LTTALGTSFQPRKTPIQARSSASVEAILQATLQDLLAVGKERLTTTRVALRAGVSVGTLYQYFPNKSALLQACLRRHMDRVAGAIEQICEQHRQQPLETMVEALVQAYISAKMGDGKASAALYAVSADVDGAVIAKAAQARSHRVVAAMFAATSDRLAKKPEVIATVVLAVANGVVRRLLEARHPEREVDQLRTELLIVVHAYVRSCIAPVCRL
jgi:AcrR family transcriptional regulator